MRGTIAILCLHSQCAQCKRVLLLFFNFFCRFSSHLMCFENRLFLIDRERIIHLVGCGRHEKIAHSFYILSLWLLLLLLVISLLPDINVLLTANFTFLLYRFIIKFHECALYSVHDNYNQTRNFFLQYFSLWMWTSWRISSSKKMSNREKMNLRENFNIFNEFFAN